MVIACRDPVSGAATARLLSEARPSCTVHFLPLDLADFSSIQRFAACFRQQFGERRLGGVICNAASMMCPYSQTAQGLETQCGVNHVGHCFLIRQLRPLLARDASRVVFVSSVAHALFAKPSPSAEWVLDLHPSPAEYCPRTAYAKSKLANLLAAAEYQRLLGKHGVLVVSLHPGEVDTPLYRHIPRLLWRLATPLAALFLQTPAQGAATSIHCALAPDLAPGGFYMSCKLTRPSSSATDPRLARDLMSLTHQLFELYE